MSLNSSPSSLVAGPDVSAVIASLFIYPIKSCGGVAVQQACLTEHGLEWDRNWMVVDGQQRFITQREMPRMALIQPTLRTDDMILRAPGMLALHLELDRVEEPVRAQVWGDEVPAYDMGAVAAQWFTDFLGVPARLVRFDPTHARASSAQWTNEHVALNQFSDGYPLLLTSQASLDGLNERLRASGSPVVSMTRFRPNIVLDTAPGSQALLPHDEDRLASLEISTEPGSSVTLLPVKPCPRCVMVNNDPATGGTGPAVLDVLQTYRQDPRLNGALSFGMNVISLTGVDQLLRVGQAVSGRYRFDCG